MRSTFRTDLRSALVAGCVGVTAIGVGLLAGCGPTPSGQPTRVIVPRGASFSEAADSLQKAGIIGSRRGFRLYGRIWGGDRNIKPGTYLLKHGTPWRDIVKALNGGRGLVNTLTIPEGYTIQQIKPVLVRRLYVSPEAVDAAVRDTALLRRLNIPTRTLEGYLFPDTYAFPAGTTASQAVREMVRGFERRWQPEWDSLLPELKINRNDLVTMASLVEKEARVPEERPVIAAVYYNRLRRGMLLQADPTVQYAMGRHVNRVYYKDLATKSPYNTYIHRGLPPGPIASPGAASLSAAANPAKVDYLYFVARPDGRHEFRRTLEQHNNARRQVRGLPPLPDSPARKAAAQAPAKPAVNTARTPVKSLTTSTRRTPVKPVARTTVKSPSRATARNPNRTAARSPSRATAKPSPRTTTRPLTAAARKRAADSAKKTTRKKPAT
ncbi:MAG: endolytic transglycosylase MltG [Gemmatimonadaceae bacterium]